MEDCFILMAMGGFFLLLGLAGIIWGRREGESYYDSLATHHDVREFLERSPGRPEPGALRIGGWIAITLGILMLAGGGALWFWG
jgi:hypothetical protein